MKIPGWLMTLISIIAPIVALIIGFFSYRDSLIAYFEDKFVEIKVFEIHRDNLSRQLEKHEETLTKMGTSITSTNHQAIQTNTIVEGIKKDVDEMKKVQMKQMIILERMGGKMGISPE